MKFPKHLKPAGPQGTELLARERSGASFDVEQLTRFMYGREHLERQAEILKLLEHDPAFDKTNRYYSSREERLHHAFGKEKRFVELCMENKWGYNEIATAEYLIDESGPFTLHRTMFIPTLQGQCNAEQRRKFLLKALNYEIIGCYAQTELGHGSNVQGLETVATYLPETQEFELHSPTLTASKWWIGSLGLAATHAVVVARLVTKGKDYGPHTFIVPLRSQVDHKPLPGVTVGDVGPKFGVNTIDNGFLLFDRYRIPHDHMLAKYSRVTLDGDYIKPPNEKLSYGTMVFVRANIVRSVGLFLARAVTVATRYSAVRRQFVDSTIPSVDPAGTETQVINYTTLQARLFPAIAQAYALLITGQWMMHMYEEFTARLADGDLEMLADVHASSSGLKSLTSNIAIEGIEMCRRACGGHGFSAFSGLTSFYADVLPNVTWEGDNFILTQQTTRYLLKTFRDVVKELRTGAAAAVSEKQSVQNQTSAYLRAYLVSKHGAGAAPAWPVNTPEDLLRPELLVLAFAHRAARLVERAAQRLGPEGNSWNDSLVEVHRASEAHCQLLLVRNFVDVATRSSVPEGLRAPLNALCALFALTTLEKVGFVDLFEDGYLSSQQADWVRSRIHQLLGEIRPNAVALVDAFALPDYLLHSALGRSDGRVYESMTEMAEREPANAGDVYPVAAQTVRAVLDGAQARKERRRRAKAQAQAKL
ncbi:acyl-CoA dehydrogenase/oxidase [Thamnocephalis sphaerospora]|uniref:Acyl-coenzyme A oxidase n=1 Tax=Thamnocephalis sphaerospora TaxID=78915 RepID=A0A4P9XPS5_9FUNG|nr:acyl-CoA dehydrogenase/oxidase [Thamnocephalis sphaerospora]|eukprot:RKP08017.1 acyl-CoA dehydrogenase/oxidase [Thamnocephalis sphaerospora]